MDAERSGNVPTEKRFLRYECVCVLSSFGSTACKVWREQTKYPINTSRADTVVGGGTAIQTDKQTCQRSETRLAHCTSHW
jgi:hypothetical protein